MRTDLENYEVCPKVFLAGQKTRLTIRAMGRHAAFGAGRSIRVNIIPMSECSQDLFRPFCKYHPYEAAHNSPIAAANDDEAKRVYYALTVRSEAMCVSFDWTFPSEQEYVLELIPEGAEKPSAAFRVYAVEPDLFGRIPLKGNMHTHSFRSDGKEAPEIVAAFYRKAGYDYIALTDHGQYAPSLEAIRAYRDVDLDMRLLPGEEVHAPDNNIHIINFGGSVSINDLMREDPEAYYEQCDALRMQMGLPDEHIWFEYASCQWVFQKIRETGGVSILAHPNWIWCGAYNIRPDVYRKFLHEGGYDALELINGGNTPEENEAQIAIWQEERANGSRAIATGSDDSHGSINGQWFDIAKTFAFSLGTDAQAIQSAIRAGQCVAVLRYSGESTRYYGSARLIAYASFLDREYFPIHDEMCFEEGRMMKRHACGDACAAARLNAMRGQTTALARRLLQADV